MTPAEVAAKLRAFNEWRRGDEDIPQFDPREIGEAIDAAVEMIDRLEAAEKERDALRTKIEQMERQGPVAFGLYSGWALKATYLKEHEACEQRDRRQLTADLGGSIEAYRVAPLYALPGAQPAPSVPEGWQLVPTAESRHSGIYKMLGALHAADNTPGMSEWESYRAMLSEAPEVNP